MRHRIELWLVLGLLLAGLWAIFLPSAPAQNQSSLAPSLKSIQTDKATMFYANASPMGCYFVEQVLPGTSGSKAATENLKSIAAAL